MEIIDFEISGVVINVAANQCLYDHCEGGRLPEIALRLKSTPSAFWPFRGALRAISGGDVEFINKIRVGLIRLFNLLAMVVYICDHKPVDEALCHHVAVVFCELRCVERHKLVGVYSTSAIDWPVGLGVSTFRSRRGVWSLRASAHHGSEAFEHVLLISLLVTLPVWLLNVASGGCVIMCYSVRRIIDPSGNRIRRCTRAFAECSAPYDCPRSQPGLLRR